MFENSIVSNLIPALLVLLLEYGVIQPFQKLSISTKRKWGLALLVSLALFVPLFLWQWLALKLAQGMNGSMSTREQVDIYASAYGLLAVLWGCIWTAFVRPWLYRLGGNA
jgi:hypothetical protein